MTTIKSIKISINWFKPEEGGRCSLLQCYQYRPTITFSKSDSAQHWSFIITFYALPDYSLPTIAEGSFLVDYSDCEPWNQMILGTKFYIMEGKKTVGIGTVLEETRDICSALVQELGNRSKLLMR